jgi:conserved oligomeric Golgi complex subunit 2
MPCHEAASNHVRAHFHSLRAHFIVLLLSTDQVDHVLSLERAAHTTLYLIQDLQSSTAQVSSPTTLSDSSTLPSLRTPLDRDTERAQFLMKLAPRIRRVESETITCLTIRLELVLNQLQRRQGNGLQSEGQAEVRIRMTPRIKTCTDTPHSPFHTVSLQGLLIIGHCMRALALLGKGKEAEHVFARVAIMYVLYPRFLLLQLVLSTH